MIKRGVVIISVMLLAVSAVSAQTPFKRELTVGGSFGASLSSVSFYPKVKTNMMLTFGGGGTIRWITSKNVGIQAELNYSQQGWDELFGQYELITDIDGKEVPGDKIIKNSDYYYRRKISYVELPFLTHIYVGNRSVRFILNIGPQVGYMISEKTEENISTNNPGEDDFNGIIYQTTEQRSIPVEKKFNWGIAGGGGMELRTGIGNFVLEGRYFFGLGDIFNTRREDDFAKAAPQVIYVKLTYLIPFKKDR